MSFRKEIEERKAELAAAQEAKKAAREAERSRRAEADRQRQLAEAQIIRKAEQDPAIKTAMKSINAALDNARFHSALRELHERFGTGSRTEMRKGLFGSRQVRVKIPFELKVSRPRLEADFSHSKGEPYSGSFGRIRIVGGSVEVPSLGYTFWISHGRVTASDGAGHASFPNVDVLVDRVVTELAQAEMRGNQKLSVNKVLGLQYPEYPTSVDSN